jgi:hypothetical protein
MSRVSFDITNPENMFTLLDNLALKELDKIIPEFNKGYELWRDRTIIHILSQFEFDDSKTKSSVEIVLRRELIPKLVYDQLYKILEKFRKDIV